MKKLAWILAFIMCITFFENYYFILLNEEVIEEKRSEISSLRKTKHYDNYDEILREYLPLTENQLAFNEVLSKKIKEKESEKEKLYDKKEFLESLYFLHTIPILILLNIHLFSLIKKHQAPKILNWLFLSVYALIYLLIVVVPWFISIKTNSFEASLHRLPEPKDLPLIFWFTSFTALFTIFTTTCLKIPRVKLHFVIMSLITFIPISLAYFFLT